MDGYVSKFDDFVNDDNDAPLKVVGLDLSLTSTGVSDGYRDAAIQYPKLRGDERLDHVTREIARWVLGADLAVIEGPAFGAVKSVRGYEDMAALRGVVKLMLYRWGIPYALVSPTTLKRYITGKGNASKAEMVRAVDCIYGTAFERVKLSHGRDDMADARGLAAMGHHRANQQLPQDWFKYRPVDDALGAVKWPELLSDN